MYSIKSYSNSISRANRTDGDGTGARSCSKQAEVVTKMSLPTPPRSRLASAAAADSFDSSKASPVPVKVENEARLPDRTTWNKVSIQDSSSFDTQRGLLWEKAAKSQVVQSAVCFPAWPTET